MKAPAAFLHIVSKELAEVDVDALEHNIDIEEQCYLLYIGSAAVGSFK
ncbi:hypothetical protein [Aridibaculum aurantiacum]|nr:hypothetical protein [Aridibaculum aurantiacum]